MKPKLSSVACTQRLCISSGGYSKRVTIPRHQTFFEKLNYKFTLNPAIDYAFCCGSCHHSPNLFSQSVNLIGLMLSGL
jgi:hypothetical protein